MRLDLVSNVYLVVVVDSCFLVLLTVVVQKMTVFIMLVILGLAEKGTYPLLCKVGTN